MFQIVTPIADTCTVSEFVKMFLVPKLLLPHAYEDTRLQFCIHLEHFLIFVYLRCRIFG